MKDFATPLVIDVGANVGQSCVEILKRLPHARIHCIEPDPSTFAKLTENIKGLEGVTTWQLAMGDAEGVAVLHQNLSPDTNSFLRPSCLVEQEDWRALMQQKAEIEVRMTTLSQWAESEKIERIHLLKTDCQGYDLTVLKGSETLLKSGQVNLLLCEVLMTPLYDHQAWMADIVSYTGSLGYRLHGFYDINYDARGDIAWADALFVNRRRG
ncbi:MAG: FkbM family methyltransferase [Verrucomicrobiaceae bacterium]